MNTINRQIYDRIKDILARGKSILLLGPRQTGKTTLIKQLQATLNISLLAPRVRLKYETDPQSLADEVEEIAHKSKKQPLIIIDEVQKAPELMDVIQYLIDDNTAQFVLTGSSARKLKRNKNINLLPGRVIPLHMDAFAINEIPKTECHLNDLLLYGSLPEIITTQSYDEKEELLESYVEIYLEEEVRAEALVRNLANFAKFLKLAASESGYSVNYSKLSQRIGINRATIAEHYQILEDCLIAERIEAFTKSKTRHKLSKSAKYLIFDLGVRRFAAKEGREPPEKYMGHLFEQFVGLELIKLSRTQHIRSALRYWKDPDGPEVDWVLDTPDKLIPIEVKYTTRPTKRDIKHLQTFLNEYDEAEKGYVVCRADLPMKLSNNITAIPWQNLGEILSDT